MTNVCHLVKKNSLDISNYECYFLVRSIFSSRNLDLSALNCYWFVFSYYKKSSLLYSASLCIIFSPVAIWAQCGTCNSKNPVPVKIGGKADTKGSVLASTFTRKENVCSDTSLSSRLPHWSYWLELGPKATLGC